MQNQANNSRFNLNPFSGKVNRKLMAGFFSISIIILLISLVSFFYLSKINKTSTEITGRVISEIDSAQEEELLESERNINLASSIILIIGILSFIFSLSWGFYISRSVSNPIKKLQKATQELQKGNFKVRVDLDTKNELEELGESFNRTVAALERIDKEHKQLEKAKTEFLSITSHELRSPMTPMKAQLQMLKKEYFGKLNPKQLQAIDIVERNTSRLDNIIVDFLEISRIEAARLKFNFIKQNPGDTIKRLAVEMNGFMPGKKIKILLKLGKLPIIEHDPDRLSQILRNLINNAIKFSPPNKVIIISAELQKNRILFSVKDQGIGIKPLDQKRIFEPFFQAEQTMYREHVGTGLGLAIVKGIVESQQGKIWLKSEPDKGTVFYFTLPLKPVREIEPIKILFSEQESIEKQIKSLFQEKLGAMGSEEFESLNLQEKISKSDLLDYTNLLIQKGILTKEKGQEFKNKIQIIFGKNPMAQNQTQTKKR